MHIDIQRFSLTGTMAYDTFNEARKTLAKDVEDSMRDEGFVPVLDLPDVFSRSYGSDDQDLCQRPQAWQEAHDYLS